MGYSCQFSKGIFDQAHFALAQCTQHKARRQAAIEMQLLDIALHVRLQASLRDQINPGALTCVRRQINRHLRRHGMSFDQSVKQLTS